jgi:hypothetical protein
MRRRWSPWFVASPSLAAGRDARCGTARGPCKPSSWIPKRQKRAEGVGCRLSSVAAGYSHVVLVCGAKCLQKWEIPIDPSLPLPLVAPASCCLPLHLPPGDLPQVVRHNTPANPPLHPFFSVLQAAIEAEDATKDADAPLYPRPKAEKPRRNQRCFSLRFRFSEGLPFLGKTTRFTPAC